MSDMTSNPLIVNAADVATAALQIWVGKIHVTQIHFTNYVATTDNATVNQGNGKLFDYLSASADLETVRSGNVSWADGLIVPIHGISNGTLRIYHK
jgi:hypothetical protein